MYRRSRSLAACEREEKGKGKQRFRSRERENSLEQISANEIAREAAALKAALLQLIRELASCVSSDR